MTARLRTQGGFTLVEVMVAAMVLLVGVLAAIATFTSAENSSKTAQRNELVVRQAERELERLRGQCYGALTMTTSFPAASASTADPLRRIVGGQLAVPGGPNEDIVTERANKVSGDGCTDADADGMVDAAVVPTSSITLGSGTSAQTGTVYRFVSWRDEECPVVGLTSLEQTITDLRQITTTLAANPGGTLTNLIGPSGSLVNLITNTQAVNTTANQANALQKLLNPTIVTLANILAPLLNNTLNPLLTTLQPMLGPLQAALAPLQSLLDRITQTIDFCDLPKLLNTEDFATLNSALQAVAPAVAALQAPINALAAIINPLASLNLVSLLTASVTAVVTLPAAVTSMTTAATNMTTVLNSVKADAANGQTKIKNLAESVTTAINTLLNQPDTTHNTKRLTVAIWLDGRHRSGVSKPFYASSVVSDPKDGIL